MKPKKPRKPKRASQPARIKVHARRVGGGPVAGVVTNWQVVKARIQEEMTAQVVKKDFTGNIVLEAGKLEYHHEGSIGRINQSDLERFATSLITKGLAAEASTNGRQVSIKLTPATVAILGGRAPKPAAKRARAKIAAPTPDASEKLVIPPPGELLAAIVKHVTAAGTRYKVVRRKVAGGFGIPAEKTTIPVVNPTTGQRISFDHNFNLAIRHLKKVKLVETNGKLLSAIDGLDKKPIPPYEAPKTKTSKLRSMPSKTARLSGNINLERLVKGLPDHDPYNLLRIWKNAVRILGDRARSHQHPQAHAMVKHRLPAISAAYKLQHRRAAYLRSESNTAIMQRWMVSVNIT
ncbi:hypothetical protein [Rhizobium sp. R693]|uniref:hypothetical protein n=1 Tax=Rhizobium sp. R693 TaxID=1764276 RepID=UPI000B52D075|nr:hypothetical protein [Rhizobium sp. R693]OWV85451.1 hypothetical protein ATY79_29690 [Rhizobium sp. R693]